MYTNLVFSGGGLACLAALSCAQSLRSQLHDTKTFIGTSGGALVAALIAIDAGEGAIYNDIISALEGCRPSNGISISNILKHYGAVDTQSMLKPLIYQVIMKAYNMAEMRSGRPPSTEPPTFRQFAVTTGKNLVIPSLNVSKSKTVVFSVDSTPYVTVIDAIAASCAVPFLFSPVTINGDLHVDAGLTDNLPLSVIRGNRLPHDTIAIEIVDYDRLNTGANMLNLLDFIKATMYAVVKECNSRNDTKRCDRIRIFTRHIDKLHFDSISGTVKQSGIDRLYALGKGAAIEFFRVQPNAPKKHGGETK